MESVYFPLPIGAKQLRDKKIQAKRKNGERQTTETKREEEEKMQRKKKEERKTTKVLIIEKRFHP